MIASPARPAVFLGRPILVPLEERWYARGDTEIGHRQFVVADPDWYLLRFHEPLGVRGVGSV